MRRGVANQFQTFSVLGGHDGHTGVLRNAKAGIDQLAVNLAAQRGFGQSGAYGGSELGNRDRTGEFTQ